MKATISIFQFRDDMVGDSAFSYEGANTLFDYLEDYEEDCGEEIEYDPTAFRCEFSEYENLEEVKKNYDDIKNLDTLREHTTVLEIPDSERLIVQDF